MTGRFGLFEAVSEAVGTFTQLSWTVDSFISSRRLLDVFLKFAEMPNRRPINSSQNKTDHLKPSEAFSRVQTIKILSDG